MHWTHPNAVFYLSASKNKVLQSKRYSVTVYLRSHSFPSSMLHCRHITPAPTQPSLEPAQQEERWMPHTQPSAELLNIESTTKPLWCCWGNPSAELAAAKEGHGICEEHTHSSSAGMSWPSALLLLIDCCGLMKWTVLCFSHSSFLKCFLFHTKKPFYMFFMDLLWKKPHFWSFPPNYTLLV